MFKEKDFAGKTEKSTKKKMNLEGNENGKSIMEKRD